MNAAGFMHQQVTVTGSRTSPTGYMHQQVTVTGSRTSAAGFLHQQVTVTGYGTPAARRAPSQPRWPRTEACPFSRFRAIVRRWISSVPS